MQTNKEPKILIEIWTDFMCPLCYIQKTNLDVALSEMEHLEAFEVVYRPFQLFPDAPSKTGRNYYDYTSMTHGGMPVAQVIEGNRPVLELARSVGLNYNYGILIPTNTGRALQVSLYAQEKEKAKEWSARAYKAYFVEGLDIGEPKTLAFLAQQAGLDPKETLSILEHANYKYRVDGERLRGIEIGIKGLPFIAINKQNIITGVQSSDLLVRILNRVWLEEMPKSKKDPIQHAGENCGISGKCI